jgi:hypothetical protein
LRRARLLASKDSRPKRDKEERERGRDDRRRCHKKTHTLVAVDVVGRRLGEKTVPTNTDGHLAALQWASQWAVDGEVVRFAVEDCRHLTRRLEGDCSGPGRPWCVSTPD